MEKESTVGNSDFKMPIKFVANRWTIVKNTGLSYLSALARGRFMM